MAHSNHPWEGPKGYADPGYAAALADLGAPRGLARSGGSLLIRPIEGTEYVDAIGSYPLFSCLDWSGLAADLDDLADEPISVSLVADPFGDWTLDQLRRTFPDRMVAFKEHFVVDLSRQPVAGADSHHRRKVKRASRDLDVERVTTPPTLLDEWCALYQNLIDRHGITGAAAFSRASFARQLQLDGLVALRAVDGEDTVGVTLWLVQGGVAYYHLGAYSERGYESGASFALFASALEQLAAAGIAWASLGAGAGIGSDATDGLSRFKRGWATGTRTAYFCGRILSAKRYEELAATAADPQLRFFPAYRQAEPV